MKLRSKLWICLATAESCLLCAAPCSGEALKNPSFEEPAESGPWTADRAAHWERKGAWFNRETSWQPVNDGECMMGYHHWQVQQDAPSEIYQDLADVPAGRSYTFSLQALKDKMTNVEHVELRLEPCRGGEPLAAKVFRMSDLKSGRWTTISVSGTPKSTGVRVRIIVKPGRSAQRKGALKFDDAQFMADAAGAPRSDAMKSFSAYYVNRR